MINNDIKLNAGKEEFHVFLRVSHSASGQVLKKDLITLTER